MNSFRSQARRSTVVLGAYLSLLMPIALPAESTLSPTGVQAGPYQRIYLPPEREGTPWYINDHCFVQDDQGLWHLFGITQSEPGKPQQERFFAHATSPDLLAPQWKTEPDVMHADPALGETLVWAPHIIKHEGLYYMFYCAGGSMEVYSLRVATSRDLFTWERHPIGPILQDGYHARDPMVLRIGDQWVLYYTATSTPSGGNHIVVAVTSDDLIHWGSRRVVFTHPIVGTYGGPTESPFVVPRDGRYYLFICENPPYNSTAVYVSTDPFHWSPDFLCGKVPSHAAEVIAGPGNHWWVSRAGWGQGGVYLADLLWADKK